MKNIPLANSPINLSLDITELRRTQALGVELEIAPDFGIDEVPGPLLSEIARDGGNVTTMKES